MAKLADARDYVARMGGDEFVIIAPNLTPDAAREKAILLNALAQQAGREVSGKNLISLSLGAAFYPQDGSDAERLLAEADRRMYAAKQLHYEHTEPESASEHSRPVSIQ